MNLPSFDFIFCTSGVLLCVCKGYQKFVDPGISPEFEVAAIRLGITAVPPGVYMRYWSFRKCCPKKKMV